MSFLHQWKDATFSLIRGIPSVLVPEGKKTWPEFGRRVWQAKWMIGGLAGLMWFAHLHGLFVGFEMAQLDGILRSQPHQMSQDIVLVEITENDYRKLFDATSPLDKFELLRLVAAVKKYNPSVIGVDILTSDWDADCKKTTDATAGRSCQKLRDQLHAVRTQGAPPTGSTKQVPAIVWAVTPKNLEPPLELAPTVGGLPLEKDREGVPRFPVDREGSVRHFESRVEIVCSDPEHQKAPCYAPTFARAILAASAAPVKEGSDEPVIFNFYGDRYRFPTIEASEFLPSAGIAESPEIEQRRAQLLEGKIVLIGGAFQEARDSYVTPLGPMQGVELNALAIQTDLSGGGIKEVSEILALLADLVISIFVVGVFYWFGARPRAALVVSFLTIPASLLFSRLLFSTVAYWFNFIPAAAGMVCHQLYELAENAAEAREKVRETITGAAGEPPRDEASRVTEQVLVTERVELLRVEEHPPLEDRKTKGAAGGAS
jgi:CHASE2 domain-containing sensor protein